MPGAANWMKPAVGSPAEGGNDRRGRSARAGADPRDITLKIASQVTRVPHAMTIAMAHA